MRPCPCPHIRPLLPAGHRLRWPPAGLWPCPPPGRLRWLVTALVLVAVLVAAPGCRSPQPAVPGATGSTPAGNAGAGGASAGGATTPDPTGPSAGPAAAETLRLAYHPQAASWAGLLAAEWRETWPALDFSPVAHPDPLQSLASDQAELALLPGPLPPDPLPPGYRTVPVGWEYHLYTAGYLAPESLADLTDLAGPAAPPAGGTTPGAVLPHLRSFADLQWGQVLLPAAGVWPSPESIAAGTYPQSRAVWLVAGPAAEGPPGGSRIPPLSWRAPGIGTGPWPGPGWQPPAAAPPPVPSPWRRWVMSCWPGAWPSASANSARSTRWPW